MKLTNSLISIGKPVFIMTIVADINKKGINKIMTKIIKENINSENKIDKILKDLTYTEKESLYRKLWFFHVIEDVKDLCDDENIPYTQTLLEKVANKYVYEGDYDCNLSYWDNIRNLLD